MSHQVTARLLIGLVCGLGIATAHAAEQATPTTTATGSVTKTVATTSNATTPKKPALVTEGILSALTLRPLPLTLPSLTLATSNGSVAIIVDPLNTKVWDGGQAATLEQLKPGVHVKVTHAITGGRDIASVIKVTQAGSAPTAPVTQPQ